MDWRDVASARLSHYDGRMDLMHRIIVASVMALAALQAAALLTLAGLLLWVGWGVAGTLWHTLRGILALFF